jgi:predicted RNase H-related nuclease YkuK (DUF458 family)
VSIHGRVMAGWGMEQLEHRVEEALTLVNTTTQVLYLLCSLTEFAGFYFLLRCSIYIGGQYCYDNVKSQEMRSIRSQLMQEIDERKADEARTEKAMAEEEATMNMVVIVVFISGIPNM